MNKNDIDHLLHKLADNQANEAEKNNFTTWVNTLDKDAYQEVLDRYQEILILCPDNRNNHPELAKLIERRLDQLPNSGKIIFLQKWRKIAVAATILLLVLSGTWYTLSLLNEPGTERDLMEQITSRYGDDILPGGDKAKLILSDGQAIILDDIPTGQSQVEGGIRIHKTGDGAIEYDFYTNEHIAVTSLFYHTITTPVGGEYQITLPDGSRVWLNSISSITAPSAFDEGERMVEVTGEVFFDIVESRSPTGKKIPFLVRTANQTVEVLGTQFNIKAYPDNDAVETTLIEGKVVVRASDNTTSLMPGEQSRVIQDGQIDLIKNINIAKVIAWKNGYFQFSDDSIKDIMNQLRRWYDIEVEYVGDLPDSRFGGQISRNKNISEVLRVLELTDEVRFRIDGQKVKIWKK